MANLVETLTAVLRLVVDDACEAGYHAGGMAEHERVEASNDAAYAVIECLRVWCEHEDTLKKAGTAVGRVLSQPNSALARAAFESLLSTEPNP